MVKKVTFFLLAVLFFDGYAQGGTQPRQPPAAQNRPRIAVYVTGGKTPAENRGLATRITHALVGSGRYRTIEREDVFLNQVAAELTTQRSGMIDDRQISQLGRMAGAQYVAVGEILELFGDHQISVRIINVESVEVVASGVAEGPLRNVSDFATLANAVSASLLGETAGAAPTVPAQVSAPRTLTAGATASGGSTAQRQQGTASGTFTDPRDGKRYRTVRIGNQTWMAENLNFERGGSWCYGGNNANCTRYGRLYNWDAAAEACPEGWHLPNRNEWNEMVKAAGGDNAATRLKARSPGWDGTNELGFSALPGGSRHSLGYFHNVGSHGYWWSSSHGGGNAWSRHMRSGSGSVGEGQNDKSGGYSVLCVRD